MRHEDRVFYQGIIMGVLISLAGVMVMNGVLSWPALGWTYVGGLLMGIGGMGMFWAGVLIIEAYMGRRRGRDGR